MPFGSYPKPEPHLPLYSLHTTTPSGPRSSRPLQSSQALMQIDPVFLSTLYFYFSPLCIFLDDMIINLIEVVPFCNCRLI